MGLGFINFHAGGWVFSIRQVSYKRTERRRGESGSEASAADKCGDEWPMNAAKRLDRRERSNESGGGERFCFVCGADESAP